MNRFTPILLPVFFLAVSCASSPPLAPGDRFQKAMDLLQPWKANWSPQGRPAEGADLDQAREALDLLEDLDQEDSGLAEETISLRLAEALFATGDLGGANWRFRTHLNDFPLTSNRRDIETYLYQIAFYWARSGESYLGTGMFADYKDALKTFEFIVDNAPLSEWADDSLRLIGEIHFRNTDYLDAIASYQRILEGYPRSPWVGTASFRIALSYLRRARSPSMDRDGLIQAEIRLQQYLEKFPEGAWRKDAEKALQETREHLARSEYEIGEFYFRVGQYLGARYHFRKTMDTYPQTASARDAEKKMAEIPDDQP